MIDPEKQPAQEEGGAHQPDGTDSSDEWQAQIADENMIPDQDPPSG
ncbi:hypothetical protein [Sphingomonas sp.]